MNKSTAWSFERDQTHTIVCYTYACPLSDRIKDAMREHKQQLHYHADRYKAPVRRINRLRSAWQLLCLLPFILVAWLTDSKYDCLGNEDE